MIAYLVEDDSEGEIPFIATVKATPECGYDFCEACGMCLGCRNQKDNKADSTHAHLWVVTVPRYAELLEEQRAERLR